MKYFTDKQFPNYGNLMYSTCTVYMYMYVHFAITAALIPGPLPVNVYGLAPRDYSLRVSHNEIQTLTEQFLECWSSENDLVRLSDLF